MGSSRHLLMVILITAALLFSSQLVAEAQERPEDPVKSCQTGKDEQCASIATDSTDQIPKSEVPSRGISSEKRSEIISHLKALQVPFIANQGQVDKGVRFYAKTFGGTLFVTDKGELIYSLSKIDEEESSPPREARSRPRRRASGSSASGFGSRTSPGGTG